MKRKILVGVVLLLLASLVVSSCASEASQEDYDAVVAERDALQTNMAKAASYAEFMAFWMGARPETEEEMQAYGGELQSRLEALDDAELSAMFDEATEASETMMAEGLTEEEMMMASLEYYMAIMAHIMGEIAEALGVEQ